MRFISSNFSIGVYTWASYTDNLYNQQREVGTFTSHFIWLGFRMRWLVPQNFFFNSSAWLLNRFDTLIPAHLFWFSSTSERSPVFSVKIICKVLKKRKGLSVKSIFSQSFFMTLHEMSQSMVLQMKSTLPSDFCLPGAQLRSLLYIPLWVKLLWTMSSHWV